MDDRQNRLICDECQKSTKEVQKVAEIKSTDLLVYSHKPNTKISQADRKGNAGDNDAHKMFVVESTNNTRMRAVDIPLATDQYKVSCPRCRYIMHGAQKSLRHISVVEGILPKNICEHCQAQIKNRPLIKEQFIYSKLKSGGVLTWRRKAKELLKDTKITKFKHKDLYLSIKRRVRRPIITTIDPTIRPLIPSLKSDEESSSGVESPIKKVSLKETVELISESQYNMDLDKNVIPQGFYYKFPKLVKKSLSEERIRDRIRSSTELFKDIQARLHMQAEEKKKKSEEIKNYKLQEKEKKRLARIEKMEKLKRSTPITSESETYKLDENIREKVYDVDELEDLGKSRKGKKSEERIDRKMREKGPQDIEQTTERKTQLFKKDSIRGKEDKHEQEKPDKEKVLPTIKEGIQVLETTEERKSGKDGKKEEKELLAPRKGKEEKSDKEKSLPAPRKELPTTEKEKDMKPGKEKSLLAPRKKEAKSDTEKGLLQASKKEKEDKSGIDNVLQVSKKPREEKPVDVKDGKTYKEDYLAATGKGLKAPEKEKETKPEKEKAFPAPGKKEAKSDKEKGLPQASKKEKEDKSDIDNVLPVSRKPREEKSIDAKGGKTYKEEDLAATGKGLKAPEKEKETKPEKEKAFPAPGKKEAKSDKEKGLPEASKKEKEDKSDIDNVLPVSRKPREEKPIDAKGGKTYKEEDLAAATGKGLKAPEKETKPEKENAFPAPGKKEAKSDKEKRLPQASKKEKEDKSDIDDVLPVSRKPREEKPVDAKGGKTYKEEDLVATGKGLKTSEKEKGFSMATEKEKEEKSDKEKPLPKSRKGAGKKEDKIDTEKASGKEKEEKTEEQILPVPRRSKDEKLDLAKYDKRFKETFLPDSEKGLKMPGKEKDVKSDKEKASAKLDKTKGKTRKKTSRGKGGEEDKETVKQEELVDSKMLKKNESEVKDLVDINKIKVTKPSDNILLDLILKFEKEKARRKPPATIIIPTLPTIPVRLRKETVGDWFTTQFDQEFLEMEKSSSNDDVVYINKIIKKHEIPSAPTPGTKKHADIISKNIFKEDLQQRAGEVPRTTIADSQSKLLLSKGSAPGGIFRYVLSDRTFIEKGWTLLPIEKVVRKTNVYRMRPAHPEFDWFEHNKIKGIMHYDSGEKLAEFKDNGLGQWFYRNGRLALDYYDAKDINAQQRIVIYSNGELDERGRSRPVTILGMFDYVGNGVIFDHKGKVRLKYNQSEGVLLDQQIGPASHWKWHSLNDPPVLQQVMIDTQMHHKDPRIARFGHHASTGLQDNNKDMVAIEFENAIKEKSQKINEKFSPFQIKMKALKINENFSIRILDQASIYLLFRDGTTNLKLNLGMLLDSHEIVDTDIADLGEISTGIERLPAGTESLEALQRNITYAQHFDRYRTERDRRLRLPVPAASVDRIKNLISKPLKPALTEVNYVTVNGQYERCYSRKPSICALYYNNRLS